MCSVSSFLIVAQKGMRLRLVELPIPSPLQGGELTRKGHVRSCKAARAANNIRQGGGRDGEYQPHQPPS